ncbi:hypothetical protein NEF87_000488 [Candidatus Lokiarchaeum ossiferum]|uniref:HTH tetR-type domain-containing protein n=1 Tax=Candidatus Lokiarchaeum ossiferum TaxID=2951803 RepID=A0ABY6HL09_9ARCH|nr:hypothetical protein NEF87_000488 [Candidatus Lokiarchaeum sp. B-35]
MKKNLTRREREKIQRTNEILTSAEKLFFKKGYDDVSVEEIAKDVELSKGTIYLYFKNKQSLYFAIINKGLVKLLEVFQSVRNHEKTGYLRIMGIVKGFAEYMHDYGKYYNLNYALKGQQILEMLDNNIIDNADEYNSLTSELFQILQESVELGINDGTLRQDLDPVQTTILLGSIIEAIVHIPYEKQVLLSHLNVTKETYIKHSIDVMMHGIAN